MIEFFKIIMPFYRLLYTERVTNPLQLFSFVFINNLKWKVSFWYYGCQGQGYIDWISGLQKANDEENVVHEEHKLKL